MAVPLLVRDLLYDPACKLVMSFGLLACIVALYHVGSLTYYLQSFALPLFLHLCHSQVISLAKFGREITL